MCKGKIEVADKAIGAIERPEIEITALMVQAVLQELRESGALFSQASADEVLARRLLCVALVEHKCDTGNSLTHKRGSKNQR
jgi:hypothetical protein